MRRVFIAALLLLCGGLGSAQTLALSSNVRDIADMGTMNLEMALGVARHWTLSAGAKYNPFTYGEAGEGQAQNRQRLLSVGARWWPWHIWSGWWLSAKGQYQEFSTGGLRSPVTQEGDRYGGGLGAGYAWMLSPHFNLDVGLGAWAGHASTVTYACPRCGRILDSSSGFFILPDKLLLAVTYVF